MSQDTIRTTIGRTYAVLVTQAPCTLYYQDDEASEKLTVLTAEEPGTYAFVAFGILLKKETGSCRIVESFNYAPLGSPAKGGVKEFYITVDDDGTRRTHNNSKLIDGSYLFNMSNLNNKTNVLVSNESFSALADGFCMFRYCIVGEWTAPLPVLVRGDGMFYGSSLTSFSSSILVLVDGINMFYASSLTSFSAILPSMREAYNMFKQCTSLTSFSSSLPALVRGESMFRECANLTSFSTPLPSLANGSSMFFGCVNLTSFSTPLPSLTNGWNMFLYCKLDKPSILTILNRLQMLTTKPDIGIGAAKDCEGDADIATAIAAAQARGWTIQISYNA